MLTVLFSIRYHSNLVSGAAGSATIAIVNAFFDNNNDYWDSDSMRQKFATYMLEKLWFVYP